jgi:NodT family efflux transporter outer membrane factor (OMF) lipoprotein
MSTRNSVAALCIASAGLLSACAVGPNFHHPPAPAVSHYANGADPVATEPVQGTAQRFDPGAAVAADWWLLFRSPQLDGLIREAIVNNPGLSAAQSNLRASQNNLRSGYGIFFPSIDADAAASRERYSATNIGQNAPSTLFNLFSLSSSVSYALDVFGGQRRLVEGLRAEMDVAHATERATYLALAANIVDTVIAEAAYRAEIEATEEVIELQKQQVRIATVRVEAGTMPLSSVLSLQSQLASYEAAIPQLQQKLVQSDDLLAALAGHTAADWNAPVVQLADLTLPETLPVSLPSDLVRQRPDILVAEAMAHTASANIGVATAALLPSVTLSGGFKLATNSASRLFPANGRSWSVAADATVPVFEGGTLWFKRKAALNEYDRAMALYRQTVLAAFEQVADTLRGIDHDAAVLSAEDRALSSAGEALGLVQANYEAGIATYLEVLNADSQYHQAKIADLQAVAVRYQDTVALFAALGGGWWNSQ